MWKKFLSYAVIVFSVGLVTFLVYAAPKGKNAGIVNSVVGTVQNFHQDETQAEVMEIGSKIYVKDRIVTEKDAKVQIVFRDDSAITLGPETEITIEEDSENTFTGKRESILSLVKGKVRSVVSKAFSQNGSSFEIRTRTAVAGVRGTQNLVVGTVTPPGTTVYGISNTTFVHNIDEQVQGEVLLGPNNGANVTEGAPPQPFTFQFSDPSFQELLNSTEAPGGGDADDDINMGALEGQGNGGEGGQAGIETAPGSGGEASSDVPPFEQETDAERTDVIHHEPPPCEPDCC